MSSLHAPPLDPGDIHRGLPAEKGNPEIPRPALREGADQANTEGWDQSSHQQLETQRGMEGFLEEVASRLGYSHRNQEGLMPRPPDSCLCPH